MKTRSVWQIVSALLWLLLLVAIGPASSGRPSFASPGIQSAVTVTSPSGAASDIVADGDDFFTRILGDPRDMNDRLDLRWQDGISNISVTGGIWQGSWTTLGTVYALFPGLGPGEAQIGPVGSLYPIDTTVYRHLSFRAYSANSASYVWWAYPGYQNGASAVATGAISAGQWKTAIHTLSSGWSGSMQGLRLQLQQAASDLRIDWLRLTNPATSPSFNITWSGAGSGEVDIYCDDDTSFGNGAIAQIANDTANDGSFTWQTAAFPPGAYYIYVEHNSDGAGNGDYSSGPLTIAPTPILDFTAPSVTSGDDYATAVVGSPWDMSDDSSILGLDWTRCNIRDLSFSGGQMHATVDHAAWCSGSDPDAESFVYLNVDPGQPIDTTKYKYLSWRWYVEGDWSSADARLSDENGWITRFIYFSTWPPTSGNTLNDVIIWEGWNAYTVDLSQPDSLDDASPGSGPGWTGTKGALRFDFMEAAVNTFDFDVDYLLLTADPTAQAGSSYTIQWTIQASERPMTITLKYDTDTDPTGFAGTIATLTPGGDGTPLPGPYYIYLPLALKNYQPDLPAEGVYRWSVPGALAGAYYIYAQVDDGLNVVGWYSQAPLVIE